MITYHEIKRNKAEVKNYCEQWFNSGDVSPGVMNLNYNMLMSVEEDALLFVYGDNDTYPKWILQNTQGVRTDVTVLNVSLLFIHEYQKAIFAENNIPGFDKKPEDFVSDEIKASKNYQLIYDNYQKALIEHVINNAGDRPVYFASTLSSKLYESFEADLYNEGLSFRYSEERYDNVAYLRKNVEKRFHLEYLNSDYIYDMSQSVVDHFNMNYLVPFSTLYEHYILSDDVVHAEWIKEKMLAIAGKVGKQEEIKKQLDSISIE